MSKIIWFHKNETSVSLFYAPTDGCGWVHKRLEEQQKLILRRTFTLYPDHIVASDDDSEIEEDYIEFTIAQKNDEYYEYDKKILGLDFSLHIHEDVEIHYRTFTAEKNVSIFSKINKLEIDPLYIGGSKEPNIPQDEFYNLISNFPNTYELQKYVLARLDSVLRDYFENSVNAEKGYQKYLNNKLNIQKPSIFNIFRDYEIEKYETILDRLEKMLNDENNYSEKQWQNEILQFILLLYPKYLHVFKEAPVFDSYSGKIRGLDFMLVDSSGNIDIVEIKKPFDQSIISKSKYRDNYIPLRELSGTVMQLEKYIFYLMKWGTKGEETLAKKYRSELPDDFDIHITNPGGIIVMGRENSISIEQKQDFEVIRRKYRNVIDIITYDDLLRRLRAIISQLKSRS